MRDLEHVARLDLAKLLAGLVEPGDLCQMPEVELVAAEQLVKRVAAANRKGEGFVLGLGCEDERYFGKDPGLISEDLGAAAGRHLGLISDDGRTVSAIDGADESEPQQRHAETDDKPLQGSRFLRPGLRRWLVIVQQRAGWAMQVGVPGFRDAAILLWRFLEVKENC